MKFLDCRGKSCPIPVIETKNFIETEDPTELEVTVDNETSCENVRRFLVSQGFTVTVEGKEDRFAVRGLKKTGETPVVSVKAKRVLVFVSGETMGQGSDELGQILMRSFLYTLKELKPMPWRIIFVNSGVKLAVEGSPYIDTLNELAAQGTDIISCGTCLDYFQIKDKVRTGRISNMYEIESSFLEATNVIKP
ncbi:MAG: SirA-like protein [Syntrophorhabdus sp. PtaU1.Bin002]|nr:MAG: SirA-like protein [Syntrophorhabdus sp. PtaB.Bin006]OPY72907.1 MAG: SirA-like protein [Syntrophorhabdus sp. PtaU1.Bin002]